MKDKLIVKHSHIEIHDYNMGDCSKLERFFSIWNPTYYRYDLKVLQYDEENRILLVPRGIDVPWLERVVGVPATIDYKPDPKRITTPIRFRYPPRDDTQKEGIAFLLGAGGYSLNKRKSQLGLHLNTGVGKSFCVLAATAILQEATAIVTSSTDWLDQWGKYILEYTDTQESEIYPIIGSASIHRLLKRDVSKYKYFLVSIQTLVSYARDNGWNKISELFQYMGIGIKCYDEAHLQFDAISKIDAYTNTARTWYVTATPARSSEEEDALYKAYLKNVPSIDLFDEEETPHTDYVAIEYNSRPNPVELTSCFSNYGFNKNAYCDYIIKKDNFYKALCIALYLGLKNKKKNIIYIAKIETIEIVYNWIVYNFPLLAYEIGVYNSAVSEDIKLEQLNKRIILSTIKSLGTAKDIKGLKSVMNLADPFKSEVLARQSLGRTRDDGTYYFDFIDVGFKKLKEYERVKKPIFEVYAKSYNVVKYNDEQLDIKYMSALEYLNQFKIQVVTPFIFVDPTPKDEPPVPFIFI